MRFEYKAREKNKVEITKHPDLIFWTEAEKN